MSVDSKPFDEWAKANGLDPNEGDKLYGVHENSEELLGQYFPLIDELDPNAKQPPFIRAPGDGRLLSDFAKELGTHLSDQNFFTHDDKCVRIDLDEKLGVPRISEINPQQLRSLIERYCWICAIRTDGQKTFKVKRSITIDTARATLASDDFRELLRPINTLNTVRFPIRRANGAVELLPTEYDRESRIFTVQSADFFNTDWSLEDACNYLRELLGEFCFKQDDRERSTSVILAYMLTLFCAHLDPNIIRPAFIITANAEGSGKTLAAKLGIITRMGYCPTSSASTEEPELKKLIFAAALSGSPVLFLDNVSNYLKSPSLEALITGPIIRDRVLGESKTKEIPNNLTVIITGNGLSISPDLQRRALLVELFLEESRPEDRVIQNPLDDDKILKLRPQILGALWAMVGSWAEKGQPKPKITHSSFLAWSETIGGILENAGFSSPCLLPVLKNSGDRDSQDMRKLVETMEPGQEFKFNELVEFAAEYDLFENLIPGENDPKAAAKRKSLSALWKKYSGRLFPSGQRFLIRGETQKTRRYLVEGDVGQKPKTDWSPWVSCSAAEEPVGIDG